MKRLLLSICAVATLASCSMDEVVSYDKGEVIGFANTFVNKSTRATDPSIGTNENHFTLFNVWGTADGIAIYAGEEVRGEVGEDEVWNCEKNNYWIKDVTYNFAALANYGNAIVGLTDYLPTSITNFDASNANVDLIYAKSATMQGKDFGENVPVSLTFNHLLSKVKFTVINNSSSTAPEYSFNVSEITITGHKSGDATLGNNGAWTWTPVANSTPAAYAVDANNGITVDKTNTTVTNETELLLIPGTFTIDFKVNTIDKDDNVLNTKTYSSSSVSALTQTLAVGTAYNFIINVSVGDLITFKVEEAPTWIESNSGSGTTIL